MYTGHVYITGTGRVGEPLYALGAPDTAPNGTQSGHLRLHLLAPVPKPVHSLLNLLAPLAAQVWRALRLQARRQL